MRISHIYLVGVAVVTLGFVASAPGAADGQEQTEPPPAEETEAPPAPEEAPGTGIEGEDWTELRSWPVERQAEYSLWPVETQTYYWTLERERQALFWRLPTEDKIKMTAMTGPERERAWSRLESRMSRPPSDG